MPSNSLNAISTMVRMLVLVGLALNLGGCASMQLTNARFWAEEAAEIAKDCPAAKDAAQAAAKAAEDARVADEQYQQANQQGAALQQELAASQADADYYHRQAAELQTRIDKAEEFTADQVESLRKDAFVCERLAQELQDDEEDWDPDWDGILIDFSDQCMCGDRECEEISSARENADRLWDAARSMQASRNAIEQDILRLESVKGEAAAKDARVIELSRLVESEENKATAALSDLRKAEEKAHQEMLNAAAACDFSPVTDLLQPLPATGLYDQDIFNAQGQGLGTPPPTFSCAPDTPIYSICIPNYQTQCTGQDTPQCNACRAAGCI